MGKNEPKPDNRRFHFQLDLPDESLPSSSRRSPSSSGKTKARPDPDRRPAHSAAPQAAARRSTASRQAAGSKAASARAARTDYERTNRASQRRPVSGYERTSAKRPRNIRAEEHKKIIFQRFPQALRLSVKQRAQAAKLLLSLR